MKYIIRVTELGQEEQTIIFNNLQDARDEFRNIILSNTSFTAEDICLLTNQGLYSPEDAFYLYVNNYRYNLLNSRDLMELETFISDDCNSYDASDYNDIIEVLNLEDYIK